MGKHGFLVAIDSNVLSISGAALVKNMMPPVIILFAYSQNEFAIVRIYLYTGQSPPTIYSRQ